MLRRLLQFAAILLIALASLTPLLELFDHWDGRHTIPANDTELRVTTVAALGGLLFATARLMRLLISRRAPRPRLPRPTPVRVTVGSLFASQPAPAASPPLVPLRI